MTTADFTISTRCPGLDVPVAVPPALLKKHLGMPAQAEIDPELAGALDAATQWCRAYARPWCMHRTFAITRIESGDTGEDAVAPRNGSPRGRAHLDNGQAFTSDLIARGLALAGACGIAVMIASTGPEIDAEIERRWREGKPDEAMCLHACAVAAIEHIRALQVRHLARQAEANNQVMVPRYSPGYKGWALSDQQALMRSLRDGGGTMPGPIELTDLHQLVPTRSTTGIVAFAPSASAHRITDSFWADLLGPRKAPTANGASAKQQPAGPNDYRIAPKALKKWADQRLRIVRRGDGRLTAHFRYDGSTCSNMGVPLAFDFQVELSPLSAGGWLVDSLRAQPSADRDGFKSMCSYLAKPELFMHRLDQLRPLLGRPLQDVLDWPYPVSPSGCLCSRANQFHKWLLALRTIHYALEQDDTTSHNGTANTAHRPTPSTPMRERT